MILKSSSLRVKWMKLVAWIVFSLILFQVILHSAQFLQSSRQSHKNGSEAFHYGKATWDCHRPEKPSIALTFDDQPGGNLDELLDILELYNATATFFVTGPAYSREVASKNLRLIHTAGHQLASHSFGHQNFSEITTSEILADMIQFDDWFQAELGFKPTYFRPPFGSCDRTCEKTLHDLGYHVVNWNLDLLDWTEPNATSASRAMRVVDEIEPSLTSGAIILLHGSILPTVQYLVPALLQLFSSKSYEFVSIAECFGGSRENWYR